MSLLDTITKALSGSDHLGNPTEFPIILNPVPIFGKLKPEPDQASSATCPIKRVTGWEISERDVEMIESGNRFCKKLRRKLKNPKSFTADEFLGFLNHFLEKMSEKIGTSVDFDRSNRDYTVLIVEKFVGYVGQNVVNSIVEVSVVLEMWELLKIVLVQGVVGPLSYMDLIEKLVDNKKADLICLCVKHIMNLRSSDILIILRYFLSPSSGDESFISVKKEWETVTLLAIEKAGKMVSQKKSNTSNIAKNAAVLLAVAYDGFSPSELCLHYLFASSHNGIELSWAISKLGSLEMLRLIRYFGKWLRKYERFPEAVPCPLESEMGFQACGWVPSLESVVKSLGLVLDEHFSYLVLYSEFHEELRSIEKIVQSFMAEAKLSCSVGNVIEAMRLDNGVLSSAQINLANVLRF